MRRITKAGYSRCVKYMAFYYDIHRKLHVRLTVLSNTGHILTLFYRSITHAVAEYTDLILTEEFTYDTAGSF